MVGLGPRRDDHESAERLGGCQTRCATGGRAMLDPWLPVGTQGPLRTVFAVLLDHLEFLQEQGSRKEPVDAFVEAVLDREAGCCQRWLRSAGLREADDAEDLGRGRAAKGTLYHYPNPYNHQTLSIAASPAPPKVAQQIYAQATLTKMCLRYYHGETMERTLAWAEGECEGFMRT